MVDNTYLYVRSIHHVTAMNVSWMVYSEFKFDNPLFNQNSWMLISHDL